MSKKWVYLFTEGNSTMRELLGGKGAGMGEMTRTGVPVPPGFTITTEACNAYYEFGKKMPEGLWDQAREALKDVEAKSGKKFGDASNPLLVSVRSGARESMPGMMDTVLNLGLNAQTLEAARVLARMHDHGADDLSVRELDVLTHMVRGDANRAIALALNVSENTIKTHVSHIFAKLQVQSRAEAVAVALQRGIVALH